MLKKGHATHPRPCPMFPIPSGRTKWKRLESTSGSADGAGVPGMQRAFVEGGKGNVAAVSMFDRAFIFAANVAGGTRGIAVEHALWVALRAVEEREELQSRLASKAQDTGNKIAMRAFEARAKETARDAAVLRGLVTNLPS